MTRVKWTLATETSELSSSIVSTCIVEWGLAWTLHLHNIFIRYQGTTANTDMIVDVVFTRQIILSPLGLERYIWNKLLKYLMHYTYNYKLQIARNEY